MIAFQWGEADDDSSAVALIAMGLTLFVLTIVVNLIATADRQPGDAPDAGSACMTVATIDAAGADRTAELARRPRRRRRRRRRTKNLVMTGPDGRCRVVVVGVVLVLVLVTVVSKGWSIVSGDFPTGSPRTSSCRRADPGPGMKAAIVGTIVITATATAIAVPLGIAGAVYLNEYGTHQRRSPGCCGSSPTSWPACRRS